MSALVIGAGVAAAAWLASGSSSRGRRSRPWVRAWRLEEFTRSATTAAKGIPNVPSAPELRSLEQLIDHVLDPLAAAVGVDAIFVSSGYRSKALNAAVGGKPASQHVYGEAADIQVAGLSPMAVAGVIRKLGLPVDQVLVEPTWVHVSYSSRQRRQFLRWSPDKGDWTPF